MFTWRKRKSRKNRTTGSLGLSRRLGSSPLRLEPLEDRRMLSVSATDAASEGALEVFHTQDALFAENAGQWDAEDVYYGYNKGGTQIYFTDDSIDFALSSRELKPGFEETDSLLEPGSEEEAYEYSNTHFSLTFDGAESTVPYGTDDAVTKFNYHLGSQEDWVDGVSTFKTVVYDDLYDGVDLHTFSQHGQMKYEFHVDPGGDWSEIELSYAGIEGLSIGEDGSLHIATELGEIVDEGLYIYQVIDGEQVEIAGEFTLLDDDTYTFTVTGDYDPNTELIIDPEVVWGSYLGGTNFDSANDVAIDSTGGIYICGNTLSSGWVSGGWDTSYGGGGDYDGFLVKLSSTGSHLWSTYFGTTNRDGASGVAIDSTGNVYVCGSTSDDGWVSGGWDTTYNGGNRDGFLVKLSSFGTHLWSTYLGGTSSDHAVDVATDSTGNVYVCGSTGHNISGWVSGGWDTSHGGGADGYLVKLSSTGGHLWSTYFGGTSGDNSMDVATDSTGNVYVCGMTHSNYWGVSGGWDTSYNVGDWDGFLIKFSSTGSHLWSTYLGGAVAEQAFGTTTDSTGNVYVCGSTESSGWVSGGWDTSFNGGTEDGFLVKLSSAGGHLWSTYLGGTSAGCASSVAADSSGNVYIGGSTGSSGWVSDGWDTSYNGGTRDGYLVKLNSTGGHLWSTYLGGTNEDTVSNVTTDSTGSIYLCGGTKSDNWGVSGSWDTTYGGNANYDGFILKIFGEYVNLSGVNEFDGNENTLDSRSVRIDPAAADDAAEMRYRFSGQTWGTWQTYSDSPFETTVPDSLLGGSSVTVEIQYRDAANNESDVYTDSLDITSISLAVSSTQDSVSADGALTLREALLVSVLRPNETITFDSTLFTSGPATITLGGEQLEILSNVSIVCPGTASLTIDANGQSRVFYVDSGITADMERLTITGGSADHGGGIKNCGTLTVVSCSVQGNVASANGGGIANSAGTMTLVNSLVVGNEVTGTASKGGGIYNNGTLTVVNSNLVSNKANGTSAQGGGIYNDSGTLSLKNSIVSLNTATSDPETFGYAVQASDYNLIDTDPTFVRNPSGTDYGDLRLRGDSDAINAGNNSFLPADTFDLDGDDNTTEPLPIDLLGNDRIIHETVDIGAYESTVTGPVLYVDEDITAGGDGLAWGTAFHDLQSALDWAEFLNGDLISTNDVNQIWIADGTYKPGTSRDDTFSLLSDVTLYGGFDATETSPNERDWATNETILSGDIGTIGYQWDNSKKVVYANGVTGAKLDGLTIRDGRAYNGGGIYMTSGTTLEVTNSTISNNRASWDGAGIYNTGGNLTLSYSTVSGNSCEEYGAGIYSTGTLNVSHSTFSSNLGDYEYCEGGAIWNSGSLTISDSTFVDNSADNGSWSYGGAIYTSGTTSVSGSTFTNNSAYEDGGAICCSGTLTVINSTFTQNSASEDGGAIHSSTSPLHVVNSVFNGNTAVNGGAIATRSEAFTFTNSTLAGNSATNYGGGIYNGSNAVATLNNSTLTKNSASGDGGGIYNYSTASLTLNNSIVSLNTGGSNPNISGTYTNASSVSLIGSDPDFVEDPSAGADGVWGTADDDYGDLSLKSTSSAKDAGLYSLLPDDIYDLDDDDDLLEKLALDILGNARVYNGTVDLGAYEYTP